MRGTTLACAAAIAIVCVRAEAAPVTFTLINTTYNAVAMSAGGRNGAPLNGFQLTIDSAAVARGNFMLQGFNASGGTIIGNTSDFISASIPFEGGISPTSNYATFNTQLTFDSAGVASGVISFSSATASVRLSGSAAQFAGSYGSDTGPCGANLCSVTGQLLTTGYMQAAVPEPLSATLVLTGLAGLGFCRRRR